MAETLPIQRKTLSNQSINQSSVTKDTLFRLLLFSLNFVSVKKMRSWFVKHVCIYAEFFQLSWHNIDSCLFLEKYAIFSLQNKVTMQDFVIKMSISNCCEIRYILRKNIIIAYKLIDWKTQCRTWRFLTCIQEELVPQKYYLVFLIINK